METFLWVEKYRPRSISECILPKNLKDTFSEFVKDKHIPNLILCGTAGVGKTTVAKAMIEDLREFTGNRAADIADKIRAQEIESAIDAQELNEALRLSKVGDSLLVGGVEAYIIRKDDKEIKLKLADGSYIIKPLN